MPAKDNQRGVEKRPASTGAGEGKRTRGGGNEWNKYPTPLKEIIKSCWK